MSNKGNPTYYGNKKYRYLTKRESDSLKSLLPVAWPDVIIRKVRKSLKKNPESFPRIPSKQHLYALVNGRVRDFTFIGLVKDLALEHKQIKEEIKELVNETA